MFSGLSGHMNIRILQSRISLIPLILVLFEPVMFAEASAKLPAMPPNWPSDRKLPPFGGSPASVFYKGFFRSQNFSTDTVDVTNPS